MSDETSVVEIEREDSEGDALLEVKDFLESIHPSVMKRIDGLWSYVHFNGQKRLVQTPDIRLHCQVCEGERTFRCSEPVRFYPTAESGTANIEYLCGDCHEQYKFYSLHVVFEDGGRGQAYKYGELPPFGIPVSNKVLRLFGGDAALFSKGRQCENLGYGVAAFAYYRRVVENHKNDIFSEIIKVCRTVDAPDQVVKELEAAKKEISFTKAIDQIKSALPQGLLINGQNPLLALHGALSVGLHDETDQDCLDAAHAVRLVLSDLVEKIAMLKQDNKQLSDAVHLLLKKKA